MFPPPTATRSSPGSPASLPLRPESSTSPLKASRWWEGERMEVIGMEAVASVVYGKGKHLISLMEMPNARAVPAPLAQYVEQGYQALSWSDGKVTYWAVSDAAADELKSFVNLFQAGAES